MGRPQVKRPERIRVELRLDPTTAAALYESASRWNLSLSAAGNRLIEIGLRHDAGEMKTADAQLP